MIEIINSTRALSNKSTTKRKKKETVSGLEPGGRERTSDQFSSKAPENAALHHSGHRCWSVWVSLSPKLTRQKQLSLLATVTKPWVVARKFLQRSTSVADRPLCSSTRVQQFILSPSAMFRDQGLSSTRRTAHEMPAWKETRANAWGRTAMEVLNFSVFLYCWVPDLNSGPDLLDGIH